MQCEQISTLLADYWAGGLDAERAALVRAHLVECSACGEIASLWTRLGPVGEIQPGPALRQRFDAMLEAYRQGLEHSADPALRLRPSWGRRILQTLASWWPAQPALQFGVALICLAAGLAGGYWLSATGKQARELARLHEELTGTRELMAVALLQQPSASERLRGVSYTSRLAAPDQEVLAALIETVKFDPSVDVRFAAVDALRRYGSSPQVRQGLLAALNPRQSPLVQIALIEALAELREPGSVKVLKRLEADSAVDYSVRERAQWAIQQF
jgi:hypothetical protein